MSIENLFLTATREKFRFPSAAGDLTVEDLWDLALTGTRTCLDNIAVALHKEIKAADDNVSFVRPATRKSDNRQAKLDIVKHVIEVKMAERDAAKLAEERAATKQRLMELVAKKQDQALEGETIEQLQARINAL